MLIDPDFFDHWRTRMLVDLLNDECAPIYLMRLWAHCEYRLGDQFRMPPHGLKATCRYAGDADLLEAALSDSGWLVREGEYIAAIGWRARHGYLFRKRPARNAIPKRIRKRVLREGKCRVCGSPKRLEVDHIIPVSRGGSDDIENLQPLCLKCNRSKSAKTMDEFMAGRASA